jgi:uncharacterized membrane protein HdeD (DUF308 family)
MTTTTTTTLTNQELTTTTPGISSTSTTGTHQVHVFLTRGIIAIAWAAAFAAVSHSATTAVTVGAGVLLVVYPLIDAVASVIDARSQDGSSRRLLLANAAFSTVTAIALAAASTGSVSDVVTVFGVWAAASGAAQLLTALRRRALLGRQWPMLLAGGVSVLWGAAFIVSAVGGNPMLSMVAVYAATGGADFVIEAWLVARRRRRIAGTARTLRSAS